MALIHVLMTLVPVLVLLDMLGTSVTLVTQTIMELRQPAALPAHVLTEAQFHVTQLMVPVPAVQVILELHVLLVILVIMMTLQLPFAKVKSIRNFEFELII